MGGGKGGRPPLENWGDVPPGKIKSGRMTLNDDYLKNPSLAYTFQTF